MQRSAFPMQTTLLSSSHSLAARRPETKRWSHYFEARLSDQFDAVIHLDETRALEPLERTSEMGDEGELPETYPEGL
jgi:erythromycin esterase-like protein